MPDIVDDILSGAYTTAEAQEKAQEIKTQQGDLARRFARLLNSDDGRELMSHLRAITVDRPIIEPEDANLPFVYARRVGQMSIYHWLNNWSEMAARSSG